MRIVSGEKNLAIESHWNAVEIIWKFSETERSKSKHLKQSTMEKDEIANATENKMLFTISITYIMWFIDSLSLSYFYVFISI